MNTQMFLLVRKPQIHKFLGAFIANPQISEVNQSKKWKVRKFVMINPKIANPQISFSVPVRKSQIRKFERKIAKFPIQIRNGLPLIFFVYLR
jgi:hypothetical protein